MKTKKLFQSLILAAGIFSVQFLHAQVLCQAGFTFTVNTNTVTFTNTSTGAGMPAYSWNFGDGNYAWQTNPSHTYLYNGTYYVCLTMYDSLNNGCQSTYCDTLVITNAPNPPCHASFTYWVDTSMAHTTYFNDSSNPVAVSWFWNFGDGNTSTQQNPIHQYATIGNYLACLSIIDINGDTCVACDSVIVAPTPVSCNALFSHFTSGTNVNFTDASTGTNANTTYSWNFGDGNYSSLQNPSHTYMYNGTYMVCLSIYDQNVGCYSQYCDTVVITGGINPPCNAGYYSYPDSNNVFSGTFQFQDTSGGIPVSWFWNFGDGGTSTQQNPIHTYSAQGTYIVCLTITTQSSGSCTMCDTVAYKVLGISEYNNVSGLKNYPNPFSRNATVFYSLKEKAEVNVSVYSDMGIKVAELENGNKESGNHQLEWNAENLNAGVYFLEIKSAGNVVSRKMILIK